MNIHENDDGVYISSQISTDDLQAIADVGIRTVICNRPDREDEGQPDFLLIQQAAAEYNISLYYVPVTGSGVAENSLQAIQISKKNHGRLKYSASVCPVM